MGATLTCRMRHSFDIARQGYVNLLGHAAPANADTVEMLAARDRFLSGGHYQPITDVVAAAVPHARRLVEVGAGTGHHLAGVLDQLPAAHGLAADVSVPACRRAAKAHPRMASVVADTWAGLPVADGQVDAVLCIFAPRNPAEFARVLSPNGVLVVVLPLPDHLQELRRAHDLIDVGDEKVARLTTSTQGHLERTDYTEIAYDLDLTQHQATDLVAMGPNAFHTTASIPAATVRVSVACITMAPVVRPSSYDPMHGTAEQNQRTPRDTETGPPRR